MKIKGTECDLGDIASEIHKRYGLPEATCYSVIQKFFEVLPDALAEFGRVEINNGGVFHLEARAARYGRNFATGEPVVIPNRDEITFSASPAVTDVVKNRTGRPTY